MYIGRYWAYWRAGASGQKGKRLPKKVRSSNIREKILVQQQKLKMSLVEMCPGNFNGHWWSFVLHLTWETAALTASCHPKTTVKQEKGIAFLAAFQEGIWRQLQKAEEERGKERVVPTCVAVHTHPSAPEAECVFPSRALRPFCSPCCLASGL